MYVYAHIIYIYIHIYVDYVCNYGVCLLFLYTRSFLFQMKYC